MKTQRMSFAASLTFKPANPERTASRPMAGMEMDVIYQEWPNRASMLKTIELQEKRASKQTDWRACKIPAGA